MSNLFALTQGDISLRIVRARDAKVLEQLVLTNRAWLRPWEATNPHGPTSFDYKVLVKSLLRQFDNHEGLPFVVIYQGEIVGQLNVANILYGSVSSCVIGYWIIPEVAGRGIIPTAVALAMDYVFFELGLHRVEVDVRPENKASIAVVEKLGLRFEGVKKKYIHINNDWRDHNIYALTVEEAGDGMLNAWLRKKAKSAKNPQKKQN